MSRIEFETCENEKLKVVMTPHGPWFSLPDKAVDRMWDTVKIQNEATKALENYNAGIIQPMIDETERLLASLKDQDDTSSGTLSGT